MTLPSRWRIARTSWVRRSVGQTEDVVGARPLIRCVVLHLAIGLLVAMSASAATLTYQSATGSLTASPDGTPTLHPASQTLPCSGLTDLNLVASVANSDATSSYNA